MLSLFLVWLVCAVAASASAADSQPRSLTVGPMRVSFLTPAVARFEFGGATEDAPSITFPHRTSAPVPAYTVRSHSPSQLVVQTSDILIRFAYEPSDELSSKALLDCAHWNVTILSSGVVACVGEASGKIPTDPSHPGVVMDEWTDIILGPPGNLGGSLDSTGASWCSLFDFSVLIDFVFLLFSFIFL